MTATKVVIIVLVLIAVLFVVFVVWGCENHPNSPKMTAKQFNEQPHPSFVGWFEGIVGSPGPKLDAAHMFPSLTKFDLQKQGGFTIKVLPDENHPVRQARFKVLPPGNACARMEFQPIDAPQGMDRKQDTDDPEAGIKNRND